MKRISRNFVSYSVVLWMSEKNIKPRSTAAKAAWSFTEEKAEILSRLRVLRVLRGKILTSLTSQE